jgi:disulfide bond formation protein DsbB
LGSLGVATRHVWLLSLPKDEAISCGPGMEIWLDRFIVLLPQGNVTETLFRSGAECTEMSWTLLGFSMPQLVFPVIILLFIYLAWLFFKQDRRMFY